MMVTKASLALMPPLLKANADPRVPKGPKVTPAMKVSLVNPVNPVDVVKLAFLVKGVHVVRRDPLGEMVMRAKLVTPDLKVSVF